MRLRYIITLLLTGSILSGTSLLFLILNVAPGTNLAIPALLTILVFFFILGLTSSLLITSRSRGEKAWRSQFNLATSIRQGIVIGALACICLWLARMQYLNFWILFVLILIAAFIEYRLLPETIREQNT